MVKTWEASRLGTNKDGLVCYEVCCRPEEEQALRKIMEVFFELGSDGE